MSGVGYDFGYAIQPSISRDAIWTELINLGVDFVNTDDLSDFKEFIKDYIKSI